MTLFAYDPHSVFLNAPFDRAYEPLLVAAIGALVCLGRNPRSTLEDRDGGRVRLDRLQGLIRACGASIHDLSRIERSRGGAFVVPRFNMPFELGLAVAIARDADRREPHRWVIFEARPYRLQVSLSDLNGVDPRIHRNRIQGVINAVLDTFGAAGSPSGAEIRRVVRRLWADTRIAVRERDATDIYGPDLFRYTVYRATVLARDEGLLRTTASPGTPRRRP